MIVSDKVIVQAHSSGWARVTSREASIASHAGLAGILGLFRMTDSLIFDAEEFPRIGYPER
jgi:hypothetical protein